MLLVVMLVNVLLRDVEQASGTVQGEPRPVTLSEPFDEDEFGESHRRALKRKFGHLEQIKLDNDYVKGAVWPKPLEEYRESVDYCLDSNNFNFRTNSESDILKSAFRRYMDITFPKKLGAVSTGNLIRSLDVDVKTENAELNLDMDEYYEIIVKQPASSLKANTVWGALRGLETFSQIVHLNKDNVYMAQKTTIKDKPRYKHRGFLIDTSRHYLPVKTINKFLDAMSYSKFNVLHWHIVDDPAFPYVSEAFPELSCKGSRNGTTHVYTSQNVQDIIKYARERGIRVIPEFDTPGHTRSWRGIPGLLTECGDGKVGPINPTIEANYKFLDRFFSEVSSVFPDKYIHLGADEVSFNCWKNDARIEKWMKKYNIDSYDKLEEYYAEKLIKIIEKLHKSYIVWQDIFDNDVKLQKDTVVNLWLPDWQQKIKEVTKQGYQVILSSCWYLNYINYGIDWPEYYFCEPEDFEGTDKQKKLIIGGTAAMWGEYVDATNILPRTWGRGLAVAERLWSPKTVTNAKDALQRIWEHRCRYLSRGIPAEPVVKGKFCIDEWDN